MKINKHFAVGLVLASSFTLISAFAQVTELNPRWYGTWKSADSTPEVITVDAHKLTSNGLNYRWSANYGKEAENTKGKSYGIFGYAASISHGELARWPIILETDLKSETDKSVAKNLAANVAEYKKNLSMLSDGNFKTVHIGNTVGNQPMETECQGQTFFLDKENIYEEAGCDSAGSDSFRLIKYTKQPGR